MKRLSAGVILALAALVVAMAAPARALTPGEIARLKKAGVSEQTIQMMLEQERLGTSRQGPVTETKDQVTYSAGQGLRDEMQRQEEHERWKEKKSMDAVQGIIVDDRKNSGAGQ